MTTIKGWKFQAFTVGLNFAILALFLTVYPKSYTREIVAILAVVACVNHFMVDEKGYMKYLARVTGLVWILVAAFNFSAIYHS